MGNRLVDDAGRLEYIESTRLNVAKTFARISSGEISDRQGAYEASAFRGGETLRIRNTRTSPETLELIAGARSDKPTTSLQNRGADKAVAENYVDTKLYEKTRAKLASKGLSTNAENVYREIIVSSGRPNAEWNSKALDRALPAQRVVAVAQPVGRALMLIGAVSDGYSLAHELSVSNQTGNYSNSVREGARIAGGWSGAWVTGKAFAASGAVIGGALGSIFPVLGSGLGATLGGIAGGFYGGFKGCHWGSTLATQGLNNELK